MTKVFYIASLKPGDGKTAIIGALARTWIDQNKKVEYLNPLNNVVVGDSGSLLGSSSDFIRKALSMSDINISPITVGPSGSDGLSVDDIVGKAKESLSKVTSDADIVMFEAPGGLNSLTIDPKTSKALVDVLGADVITVVDYSRDLDVETVVSAIQLFGDSSVGVVVNRVPKLSKRLASETLGPALEHAGLNLLGIVPEDRALFGVTVADLVERLGGRFVVEGQGHDLLVENIVIGANVLDAEGFPAGPEYFGRRDKKAVIAKGDRPDFQWAAMDTPTRCLILTGNFSPIPYVIEKAETLKMPLAVVEQDTLDTLDSVEEIFSGHCLDAVAKVDEFCRLAGDMLDRSHLDALLEE